MFEIMKETKGNCIGVEVRGEVQAEDYEKLEPILENAVKAHGTANLVVHVDALEGIGELDVIRRDAKLFFEHFSNLGKMAVVGTKKWQEWVAKLTDPIMFSTKVKYFNPEELDEAWTWACGAGWKE